MQAQHIYYGLVRQQNLHQAEGEEEEDKKEDEEQALERNQTNKLNHMKQINHDSSGRKHLTSSIHASTEATVSTLKAKRHSWTAEPSQENNDKSSKAVKVTIYDETKNSRIRDLKTIRTGEKSQYYISYTAHE